MEQSPELCWKEFFVGFPHTNHGGHRHRFRFVLPDDGLLEVVDIRLTHDH
jgi:hypothetical protein